MQIKQPFHETQRIVIFPTMRQITINIMYLDPGFEGPLSIKAQFYSNDMCF